MVYVAFVIDAYARRIIGWRVARTMTTDLVLDAVEHALFTRRQQGITDLAGLIAHSDAGSQYVSIAVTQRLIDESIDPSVGSVGDALDNALAETTVRSFKNELIRRQGPWRDADHIEVETLHGSTGSTPSGRTSTSTTSHPPRPSNITTTCETWQSPGDPRSESPDTPGGLRTPGRPSPPSETPDGPSTTRKNG